MRQIFLGGDGQPQMIETPVPGILTDSALIETSYSLISSGTEGAAITSRGGVAGVWEKAISSRERVEQAVQLARKQGIKSTIDLVREKMADATPLGYSCSGIIREIRGESLGYHVGERVACFGTGFASHAEYNVIPRNLMAAIPNGVSEEDAAFGAIACIAMQGIRRLELTPGENIGVIGLGLIGQICVRLLTALGYRAFASDISPARVAMAQSHGAVGWMGGDNIDVIFRETGNAGLDGVIICAASNDAALVNNAFDLCRKRGRVAIVGSVSMELLRDKMYQKELELRLSSSYGPGRYDPAYEIGGHDYPIQHARWTENRSLGLFIRLLHEKRIDISDLRSKKFAVTDYQAAYAEVKNTAAGNFGILFDYGTASKNLAQPKSVARSIHLPVTNINEGKVRIGLIGVGAYAKNIHLPNLRALPEIFSVEALASRSGATAAAIASRSGARLVTSDYHEMLADDQIDAVLISTRHAAHGGIICDALDAGKHVYVEKPMTITIEEADKVIEKVEKTGLCVRVGFNRRFSPYCLPFRQAIGDQGIGMLTIRVNIGSVGSHWSSSSDEGGRFLGEATHFIDLANWVFGEFPISIQASSAGQPKVENPNVGLLLSYPSGGNAMITYSSLGHPDMGKEFFELFVDGKSIRCDDFSKLTMFGAKAKTGNLRKGDKGQREALAEFGKRILGQEHSVMGADALAGREATRIALQTYEIARSAR